MAITNFKISFEDNLESISFGITSKTFEVGEILFLIDSIDNEAIELFLIHFRNQRELLTDFWDNETSKKNVTDRFKILTTLGTVNCLVNDIDSQYSHLSNSKVGDLLYLFPLAQLLMRYRNYFGYKSIAERYPNYVEKYYLTHIERLKPWLLDPITNRNKSPEKLLKDVFFPARDRPKTEDEKVYRALDHIAWHFISGERLITTIQDNAKAYCEAAIGYSEIIISNLVEIRRIKPLIKEFVQDRTKKKSLGDILPQWILSELRQTLKPEWVLSLTTAIALEQEYLYKKRLYLRTCPICKSSFIAYRVSTKYCSNPNPEYNGRTCQEIGKNEGPESKMKLYPLFNTKRKIYCNWRKKQYDRYTAIFNSEKAQNIEEELNQNYKGWHSKAHRALYQYELGKIQLKEAETIINLPEIEYRSPLLYKLTHK